MFEQAPQGGLYERLVERWRSARGIDQWPVVTATLLRRNFVPGNEGGNYYDLVLSYPMKLLGEPALSWHIVTLPDLSSYYSYVKPGETIELRANPAKPSHAVFNDVSVNASGGRFGLLLALGLASAGFVTLLLRSCH